MPSLPPFPNPDVRFRRSEDGRGEALPDRLISAGWTTRLDSEAGREVEKAELTGYFGTRAFN